MSVCFTQVSICISTKVQVQVPKENYPALCSLALVILEQVKSSTAFEATLVVVAFEAWVTDNTVKAVALAV